MSSTNTPTFSSKADRKEKVRASLRSMSSRKMASLKSRSELSQTISDSEDDTSLERNSSSSGSQKLSRESSKNALFIDFVWNDYQARYDHLYSATVTSPNVSRRVGLTKTESENDNPQTSSIHTAEESVSNKETQNNQNRDNKDSDQQTSDSNRTEADHSGSPNVPDKKDKKKKKHKKDGHNSKKKEASNIDDGRSIRQSQSFQNQIAIQQFNQPYQFVEPVWSKMDILQLLQFPDDDFIVLRIAKPSRVEIPSDEISLPQIQEPYIREIVKIFTGDCKIIYQHYQLKYGNKSKLLSSASASNVATNVASKSVRANQSVSTPEEKDKDVKDKDTAPSERVPDAKHLSDPGQLRTGVELLKDLLDENGEHFNTDLPSPGTSQPATPSQTPSSSRKTDVSAILEEFLHKIPPYSAKDPSLLQLRQDLFKAFPVSEKDLNPGVINPPEPFTERLAPHLLILNDFFLDVSHISQQLENTPNMTKYPQPLFFSFSLHNYKTKQKLSEDFHVISFGEMQYKMEHSNWTNKKGLFALPTTIEYSSVVLVVTINKVFSSSDKDSAWFKEKEKDSSQGKTLRRVDSNSQSSQVAQDASEYNAQVLSLIEYIRNGQLVITPLLWGYTQIFDSEGKLMGSVQNPVQLAKQMQNNSREASTPSISQLPPQAQQSRLKTRKFDPDLKLVKSGMCVTYDIIYDAISNETHGKTSESNAISVMSLPSLVTSNLPLNFNERQKFKSSGCKFEIELAKLSHEPKSPRITPSQYQVKTNYETALQYYHNLFGIAHSNPASPSSATRIQQFQAKQRLPFSASSSNLSNLSSHINASSVAISPEKDSDDNKHHGLGVVQEIEVWGETQNFEDPNQDKEKQEKDFSPKDTSGTSTSYPYLSYVNNLYVYIESVNVKAPSDANIQVKVQLKHNDKNLHSKDDEKCFYSITGELVPFMFTSVASHTKTPQFCDEMKLKLPPNLTPEYHLLFTFYNCTVKKGNKIYYPLAHAVLPLYKGSRIVSDDRYSLPVSKAVFSDANYLNQDVKWSKEKRLSVRTKLVSSIYPQDGELNLFFLNYWREPANTKQKPRSSTQSQPKPIIQASEITESVDPVKAITNVPVDTIIKFMPPIMNILFQLIAKDDKHQAREAFITLLKILKRIDVHTNYSSLLHSYVVYLFDNPVGRGVYESICSFWLAIIESPMCGELMGGFKSYWFLFQVILKSLILELNSRGFLHSASLRYSKVPSTFQSNIIKLLSNLLRISMQSQLNYDVLVAFPLFITNLFPFINRGQLFKLIFQHLASLDLSTMSTAFIKFTWLKIIGDYEHYVPLNLPTDLEMENFDVSQLKSEFWKRHFLSGVILDEASCCLRSSFNSKIREQAATLLRNLFRKHELDARYQNTNIQKYIASMYFPLVPMIIEQLYLVNEMAEVEQSRWLICFIYILKYVKKKVLATWWRKESQKTKEAFWSCVHTAASYFVEKPKGPEVNFIVLDTVIEFVNCFEKSLNKVSDSGIDNESQSNPLLEHILDILKILLSSPSDTFLSYLYCALNDILSRLSSSLFQTQTRYYCRDLIYDILRHCNQKDNDVRSKASSLLYALIKENWKQFKNISVIRHFAQLAQSKLVGSEKKKEYNYLLGSLDGLKKHCLADKEVSNSEGFVHQVHELVTRLVDITKYEKKIAQNWVDEEVTADIYIQIANDYRESPDLRLTWLDNLALIHVQWGNIEEAAQCKIHMSFLVAQYLVRMKPNVLPKELRLAIPLTINDKNLDLKDKLNPSIVHNPFARIAPNILTDLHLSDEIFQDEGRFQSERWSIVGLSELLRDAVTLLKRERRYELCLEIYHLLASIYKHDKNYAEMIKWAEQYKDICENLVKLTVEGKEIFSRYYRVTFFSKKWFAEDHRKIFIYKKKYRFTIGDVAQMIAKQLAHKTRLDPSQIVSLPNKEIDHSTLDLEKIYFQIVAVKPYFDEVEQQSEDRVSQFQQNFNISEFISEVPFMSDGGKFDEADVSRQQKRKTIFCIGKSFPYLNNRIEVAQSRDIVLSPIECAVEAMQQRAAQFRSEVYCTPVRKNNLQALMTGTLATTVNVGPLRFCEVFIGNSKYSNDLQDKLRDAMAEVLLLSKAALQINERIIGPEQLPFQAMLEDKFQSTMQIFKTKFAGNVNWAKISSTIQQRELKAKQQANELEKKLVKQGQKPSEN